MQRRYSEFEKDTMLNEIDIHPAKNIHLVILEI